MAFIEIGMGSTNEKTSVSLVVSGSVTQNKVLQRVKGLQEEIVKHSGL